LSQADDIKKKISAKLIFGYSLSRSALFFMESKPLPYIRKIFNKTEVIDPPEEFKKKSFEELGKLFKEDAQNITDGIYPQSVLTIEKPIQHIKRVAKIWKDAFFISYRRSRNKNKQFSTKAKKLLGTLPSYYQRNFHNQTDGYLSEDSAEIYDHQVDMLFSGSTDAMRRSLLKPLSAHLKRKKKFKILEIGCGAGSFTQFLAKTFTEATITAVDLSPPYLKKAQDNLSSFSNINFHVGKGEELDFKSETFDAVVSVFLFHELPLKIREDLIKESKRVLKNGGFFGLVDSLQMDDISELNWALKEFPKSFHEPFYINYVKNPIEKIVQQVFEIDSIKTSSHFLSKCVTIEKSI